MATSTAVPTVIDQWSDGNKYHVIGTLAIGATPLEYLAGGLVLNFLQAAIKASRAPLFVTIQGISGYVFEFVYGTDASDGKVIVLDGALAEIADAAIPAGLAADTIRFHAIFAGML